MRPFFLSVVPDFHGADPLGV
ncbi:hypothetical protein L611_002200000010, partial [Aminobacter sp. J15]